MKIRSVKFENHQIFENLHLDFTDSEGKTINTIIIAGENGVGKSLLLNAIYNFSLYQFNMVKKDEKIIFEIELSKAEIDILKSNQHSKSYFENGIGHIFKIVIDYSKSETWEQYDIRYKLQDDEYSPTLFGTIFAHPETKKILKSIFSDVEINFTPSAIQSVTAKNIDLDEAESEKSGPNLATEITQLLIDIQSLDALEFTDWARNNPGIIVDENKLDSRIKRFTNAFHYIFPSKKYKTIKNYSGNKTVVFEENGNEMNISQLSSGEKQIVFRGGFLLKNKESSKGSIVLLDEPEISLHPNWQLKILNFFKKLFTDINGIQTSQLIIATHSPFIIHNSNRKDDKVIILKKDVFGKIYVSKEPEFYGWSMEKIVQEAFNIDHFVKENRSTVFLEGETDERYYKKCVEIFSTQSKLIFTWIGRTNDKGNVENTGDTALNQAKTFFTANMELTKGSTVILLYDNDTNKPEEDIANLLIRKMSKNNQNTIYKIGVENLLTLIPKINTSDFYKERKKFDDYGAESIIRELDKTKLCNFICDELDIEDQKIVLQNILTEIKRLETYLD